jgi:hypothetical protein
VGAVPREGVIFKDCVDDGAKVQHGGRPIHSVPINGRTPSMWKKTRYLLSSSLIGGA